MGPQEDYAAYLSEAAQSEIAVFHEFRINFHIDRTSYHVFLEGSEDRLYYMPDIREFSHGQAPHCYVCDGKPNLKIIRDEIKNGEFDYSRCIFFVDRDYDDFLQTQIIPDSQTYITDYYSIESDLVSDQALEVLLVDFAGFSKLDSDYSVLQSRFSEAVLAFEKVMRPISAWILATRMSNFKINLNNVNMPKIIEIKSPSIVRKKPHGFDEFRKEIGLEKMVTPFNSVRSQIKNVSRYHPKSWIRGKFELWFFRAFLLENLNDLKNSKGEAKTTKWKVPLPVSNNTLFEALGGRLPKPTTLRNFLRRTLYRDAGGQRFEPTVPQAARRQAG